MTKKFEIELTTKKFGHPGFHTYESFTDESIEDVMKRYELNTYEALGKGLIKAVTVYEYDIKQQGGKIVYEMVQKLTKEGL